MNLFELDGTVTAIGQNIFDNNVVVYAYIEITASDGGRTMVEKVAVCNDIGASLQLGMSGRFYVDRLFRLGGSVRSQLWGLKTDRIVVFDRIDLRWQIAWAHIVKGVLTLPVLGLGLILLPSALHLLALSIIHDRRKFFGATTGAESLPITARQVARI